MAVTVNHYNKLWVYVQQGFMDIDTDTIKVALLDNNHSFTATNTAFADVSANEIAGSNGYTSGGQAIANATITESSGTANFDHDDVVWTASGGSITAYNAVYYDDTMATGSGDPVTDGLILDISFGEEKSAGDGTEFKLVPAVDGVWDVG